MSLKVHPKKMLLCASYLISYLYKINSVASTLEKKVVNLIELTVQLLWKNTKLNLSFFPPSPRIYLEYIYF